MNVRRQDGSDRPVEGTNPQTGRTGLSDAALYLAMWSGPRNISTAMMRSWGNRPDTIVCDEPLYAHYLMQTRAPHPGIDEILAHHETDWRKVVDALTAPLPPGKRIFYQKHMAHHLLPSVGREWLSRLRHAFLIREPREMLTSLVKITPNVTLMDTGLPQQVEIIRRVQDETGSLPPIVDARDVLMNPPAMLRALCAAVGVTFTTAMLSWPPGRRKTDGVWARYWYAAVEKSTGFEPYRPKDEPVPPSCRSLLPEAERLYRWMHERRLRPDTGD